MISKIKQNRIKKYRQLIVEAREDRVTTRDGKQVGIIIGDGPDYTGEAGFSRRARVLWKDGSTTLCTYKGMQTNPLGPGWKIL